MNDYATHEFKTDVKGIKTPILARTENKCQTELISSLLKHISRR